MKPSLQVRLSQHLALTRQLQQSIRLLQLSTLELHQEVGQMLDQNPFLEVEEDAPPSPFEVPQERQSADRVAESDVPDAPDAGEAVAEIRAEEFGTTEREDWSNGTEGDDFDGIRETPSGASGSGSEGDESDDQDRRGSAYQRHPVVVQNSLFGNRYSQIAHGFVDDHGTTVRNILYQ